MSIVRYLGCREVFTAEGKKTKAGFFKITPQIVNQEYINHHILLADVSGSMSGSIDTLRERIVLTMKALLQIPKSYVSIITYSGHDQSKRIASGIKCDEISYQMADIWNVIEKELYIKSVTVISEPLEQSIEICKSLMNICNKHHIALFTDGCLVPTRWPEEKEREKCFKVAEICCKEGIFLNAIGFGQYNDRGFLKQLIEISGNGTVIHIDEIQDYSDVILEIIRKVNNEKIISLDIKAEEGSVLDIGSSIKKNLINIRKMNNDSIMLAVLNSNSVKVQDENYQLDFGKELEDEELGDSFYYSLARYYAQEEDMDNMEFIIKALGDIALFNKIQNCYSFIEKGNAVNRITEVLEDKSKRFAEGRKPVTASETEKLCILEILQCIIQDKDSELYWDVNTPYHRITQHTKQTHDNIIFKRMKNGLIPVTNISLGSEKLNIGIKVRIPGEVTDTTSGLKMEACIFRDYNIINSGNINVPYINARLSENLYRKFASEEILVQTGLYSYIPGHIYTINLQGIKSVNKRVLKSMGMREIASELYEIADLKCRQWAINQLVKEITGASDRLSFSSLPPEGQEIRRLLRIDDNGIYTPASLEKDYAAAYEIYPAMFFIWDIAKFPEKSTREGHLKSLSEDITNMRFEQGCDDKVVYDFLCSELAKVRYTMRAKEFKINSVRIAAAITNKSPFMWEETGEKAKTATDKILGRNMVVGGKLSFYRKSIDGKVVEQQKWVQLIKCN